MTTSKLLDTKLVKFYGSSALHSPKKKLIVEDYSDAFNEGRKAYLMGQGSNENPYNKGEGDAIWNKYDCWLEGYKSCWRY